MTTVVTVAELHALRRRHAELDSVNGSLRRLGHPVPVPVAAELETLGSTTVDVMIRCLLCQAYGTFPAAVNDDATPQSAICSRCDDDVFDSVKDAG